MPRSTSAGRYPDLNRDKGIDMYGRHPEKLTQPAERQLEVLKAKRDRIMEKDKQLTEEIERLEARIPAENEVREQMEKTREMMRDAQKAMNEAAKESRRLGVDTVWWHEQLADPRLEGALAFGARRGFAGRNLDRDFSFELVRKHRHRKR